MHQQVAGWPSCNDCLPRKPQLKIRARALPGTTLDVSEGRSARGQHVIRFFFFFFSQRRRCFTFPQFTTSLVFFTFRRAVAVNECSLLSLHFAFIVYSYINIVRSSHHKKPRRPLLHARIHHLIIGGFRKLRRSGDSSKQVCE